MAGDCGKCTMCCKLMGVVELDKPKHTQCNHCQIGVGCKIYNDRPISCREFKCIWLQTQATNKSLPLQMRPDKSKVVLHTTPDEKALVAKVDPNYPDAWKWKQMGYMLGLLSEKTMVLVDNSKEYWLLRNGKADQVEMSAPDKDGVEHFEGFSGYVKIKETMVKE